MKGMSFKFWRQFEILQGQQGIFWYVFLVDENHAGVEDPVNEFIHSDHLKNDCQPLIVKEHTNKSDRFLEPAFKPDSLSLTDFKMLKKDELVSFFDEYSKDDTWGKEDKDDFVMIMNKFIQLIPDGSNARFFLLSKEWFDKGNSVLNEDSDIYIYYFLIIWLDPEKKIINVCQWNYD